MKFLFLILDSIMNSIFHLFILAFWKIRINSQYTVYSFLRIYSSVRIQFILSLHISKRDKMIDYSPFWDLLKISGSTAISKAFILVKIFSSFWTRTISLKIIFLIRWLCFSCLRCSWYCPLILRPLAWWLHWPLHLWDFLSGLPWCQDIF